MAQRSFDDSLADLHWSDVLASISEALLVFSPERRVLGLTPAAEMLLAGPHQVVVADRGAPGAAELVAEFRGRFLPFHSIVLADEEARVAWGETAPALRSMLPVEGRAAAYVCRDFACQPPVSGVSDLGKLLQ